MKVVKLPVVSDVWRIQWGDPMPPDWVDRKAWMTADVKQGDALLREPSGTVLHVVASDFRKFYSPCRDQSDMELAVSFAERHGYSFESKCGKPTSEFAYTICYEPESSVLTLGHADGNADSYWQAEYHADGSLMACGICTDEVVEAFLP